MKQVVMRGGSLELAEVPAPSPAPGRVLVANRASVISAGTERAAVSSGGGSLPTRAIRNPELVRRALEHLREHGLRETLDLARGVTAPSMPLGYSSAGIVLDTGGIPAFQVGQLVACAGAGAAGHAEVVSVPANLVAAAPEGVTARQAAFATLGAIALQGVRRAQPTLGERVVVVGLGLLGLLTMQLLRAAGCPVLGVEPVARRRQLGLSLGAERCAEPETAKDAVLSWTSGEGADAVIVTAASSSPAVVNQAIGLLRRKGRVVPVGDVNLALERPPLYEREADVLISTSYGPGRYDSTYEEGGIDYPLPYVRWTENRNMSEVLRLLAAGQLDVEPLIELEQPLERAGEAYAAVTGPEPPLAAVLTYPEEVSDRGPVWLQSQGSPAAAGRDGVIGVAIVGAGGFVRSVHLPHLEDEPGAVIRVVANRSGTSARDAAALTDGADATTDWQQAIARDDVELVLVGTRHDSHAEIAAAALRHGKAVFLEKPLGLSRTEIDEVWAAGVPNPRLIIGFNRPFAPLAQALRSELGEGGNSPSHVIYRVNAPLPAEHWLNDPAVGGGRVQGEACHMFDFVNWLCGTPVRVWAAALPTSPALRTPDSVSVTVQYAGGSVASVHYSGAGSPNMPKERIEVLSDGRSWVLDDFRSLSSFGSAGSREQSARRADKGHRALLGRVLGACRGERPYEPGLLAAYMAQSVALAALESIASGAAVEVIAPDRGAATAPPPPTGA